MDWIGFSLADPAIGFSTIGLGLVFRRFAIGFFSIAIGLFPNRDWEKTIAGEGFGDKAVVFMVQSGCDLDFPNRDWDFLNRPGGKTNRNRA